MTRRLLLTASASSLLTMALSLATPALAAAPTSEIIVITDFQYVDEALCGFPVTFVDNGTFKLTTFYDDAGKPSKSVATNYRTRYTVSATANGKTLTTNAPAVVVESFEQGTELVLGLHNAYHVPGEGVVLLDAGTRPDRPADRRSTLRGRTAPAVRGQCAGLLRLLRRPVFHVRSWSERRVGSTI
jgi:hypothetical protein